MPQAKSTDDFLRSLIAAVQSGRPRNQVCIEFNLAESTIRHHLREGARRGLMGYRPVLEGFELAKVTSTPKGDYIQQRPERGPEFAVPANHQIKGVSALVDAEGRVINQWIKTKAEQERVAEEAIRGALDGYRGRAEPVSPPAYCENDLETVYVIGDHHLGMYAWKNEAGQDYDTEIGKTILLYAMRNLLAATPPSGTAIILSLGDYFHTDSSSNRTPESGHSLDIDTRRSKVCRIGVEVLIELIELALCKHKKVIVRCLPGNHDPESTPWLSIALSLFFSRDLRVEVDLDPSYFWFHRFGKVFLAATHGDKCKMGSLPMAMASYRPDLWGATDFRYGLGGHIHHKTKIGDEIGGVEVETYGVLAPPDSWHASMGFRSGRRMVAITFHKENGKETENTVNINPRS